MKLIAQALLFLTLIQAPDVALACGSYAEPKQAKLDMANLSREHELARVTAARSSLVVIGEVTSLVQPPAVGAEGTVTLRVEEALKGKSPTLISLPWKSHFVISCRGSEMFLNVGFRESWKYIVYVQNGTIIRSSAVNRGNYRSALSISAERGIAQAASRL